MKINDTDFEERVDDMIKKLDEMNEEFINFNRRMRKFELNTMFMEVGVWLMIFMICILVIVAL